MQADLLLAHADRLLAHPVDEADLRRSASAYYYAVFDLLTVDAAAALIAHHHPRLQASIRRSIEHRAVVRVCKGLLDNGPTRPNWLVEIVPDRLPAELLTVAKATIELQTARLDADYDLTTPTAYAMVLGCRDLAHGVFSQWASIRTAPAAEAFLIALVFHDRLSRRG